MEMRINLITFSLIVSARFFYAALSDTRMYHKVLSSFPSGMNNCLLQKFSLSSANYKNTSCASYCIKNANCRLFCIKGDECTLFKTWVTAEYYGSDPDYFGFTSCYTSWFFSKNLAPQAVVTMSEPYSVNHAENQATNGYFCFVYDSCSITKILTNPWWRGDLQKVYLVSTLIVKPREDNSGFSNIEIRFGNSMTISQNPIFSTFMGPSPPPGSVLTFKLTNPMAGRYLSFQKLQTNSFISICELQIIEA